MVCSSGVPHLTLRIVNPGVQLRVVRVLFVQAVLRLRDTALERVYRLLRVRGGGADRCGRAAQAPAGVCKLAFACSNQALEPLALRSLFRHLSCERGAALLQAAQIAVGGGATPW